MLVWIGLRRLDRTSGKVSMKVARTIRGVPGVCLEALTESTLSITLTLPISPTISLPYYRSKVAVAIPDTPLTSRFLSNVVTFCQRLISPRYDFQLYFREPMPTPPPDNPAVHARICGNEPSCNLTPTLSLMLAQSLIFIQTLALTITSKRILQFFVADYMYRIPLEHALFKNFPRYAHNFKPRPLLQSEP